MVNWPSNPTDGQEHTEAGTTWIYKSPPNVWDIKADELNFVSKDGDTITGDLEIKDGVLEVFRPDSSSQSVVLSGGDANGPRLSAIGGNKALNFYSSRDGDSNDTHFAFRDVNGNLMAILRGSTATFANTSIVTGKLGDARYLKLTADLPLTGTLRIDKSFSSLIHRTADGLRAVGQVYYDPTARWWGLRGLKESDGTTALNNLRWDFEAEAWRIGNPSNNGPDQNILTAADLAEQVSVDGVISFYASPTGTGDGLSGATPASLYDAMMLVRDTMFFTNNTTYILYLAAGTYEVNQRINFNDGGDQLWKFGDNKVILQGAGVGTGSKPSVLIQAATGYTSEWLYQSHHTSDAFKLVINDVEIAGFNTDNKSPLWLLYGGGYVYLNNVWSSNSTEGLLAARDCTVRVNGSPNKSEITGLGVGKYAYRIQNCYFRIGGNAADDLDNQITVIGSGSCAQVSRGSVGYIRRVTIDGAERLAHIEKYSRLRTQSNEGKSWTNHFITKDHTGTWNYDDDNRDILTGASNATPVLGYSGESPDPFTLTRGLPKTAHRNYFGAQYNFAPVDAENLIVTITSGVGSADLGAVRLPNWYWYSHNAMVDMTYTLEALPPEGITDHEFYFILRYGSTQLLRMWLPITTNFDRISLSIQLYGSNADKSRGYYVASATYASNQVVSAQGDLPTFNANMRQADWDDNKMDTDIEFRFVDDQVNVTGMVCEVKP